MSTTTNASTLLLLAALGCGATQRPGLGSAPSCLEGPPAAAGGLAAQEQLGLFRREWDRARAASPFVRAQILEALPPLSPDLSDLVPAPDCRRELAQRSSTALAARPLPFDRLTVARLRTTHEASTLLALIALPASDIADYQRAPQESGAAPSKELVRQLAMANLPVWAWAANQEEARTHMFARLEASRDDWELLTLHPAARLLFDDTSRGRANRQTSSYDALALRLLRSWRADVERRLEGPSDRVSFEIALQRIAALGQYGWDFGLVDEIRPLMQRVIDARGDLPIARGIAGGARDLAELAFEARFTLRGPRDRRFGYDAPVPRRPRVSVATEWSGEPAGGEPLPAEVAARIRDLDGELARLETNAARCYALRQLGRWLPADRATARFDELIAPVFDGERIRVSTETLCRLDVALDLDGVDPTRRRALLLRLLSTPDEAVGKRDHSKDGRGAFAVNANPVRAAAARVLARHLEWIEQDESLRAWLTAMAAEPVPLAHGPAEAALELQPALEHLLRFQLSGATDADPAAAAAMLRTWMTTIGPAEQAVVSHIYVGSVVRARLRAIGELARRAGLAEEAAPFLAARADHRAGATAAYLLEFVDGAPRSVSETTSP